MTSKIAVNRLAQMMDRGAPFPEEGVGVTVKIAEPSLHPVVPAQPIEEPVLSEWEVRKQNILEKRASMRKEAMVKVVTVNGFIDEITKIAEVTGDEILLRITNNEELLKEAFIGAIGKGIGSLAGKASTGAGKAGAFITKKWQATKQIPQKVWGGVKSLAGAPGKLWGGLQAGWKGGRQASVRSNAFAHYAKAFDNPQQARLAQKLAKKSGGKPIKTQAELNTRVGKRVGPKDLERVDPKGKRLKGQLHDVKIVGGVKTDAGLASVAPKLPKRPATPKQAPASTPDPRRTIVENPATKVTPPAPALTERFYGFKTPATKTPATTTKTPADASGLTNIKPLDTHPQMAIHKRFAEAPYTVKGMRHKKGTTQVTQKVQQAAQKRTAESAKNIEKAAPPGTPMMEKATNWWKGLSPGEQKMLAMGAAGGAVTGALVA